MKLGFCNEGAAGYVSSGLAPYAFLKSKLGFGIVRLGIAWQESPIDWTITDAQIEAITDAGMIVMANFAAQYPPSFTGGLSHQACTIQNGYSTAHITVVPHSLGAGPVVQPQQNPPDPAKPWARPTRWICPRGGTIDIPMPGVLASSPPMTTDVPAKPNYCGLTQPATGPKITKDAGGQHLQTDHGIATLNAGGNFSYTHDGSDSTEDAFGFGIWTMPPTYANDIHFDAAGEEHAWCAPGKTPPVDSAKVSAFVAAFAARYAHYGDKIVWSCGNEVHNDPAIFWAYGGYAAYFDQVWKPFYDAVNAANPKALIQFGDCDQPEQLDHFAEMEKAAGHPLADIIGFHAYTDPNGVMTKLRKVHEWFLPRMKSMGNGRPGWLTEGDGRVGSGVLDFIPQLEARGITAVVILAIDDLLKPGWTPTAATLSDYGKAWASAFPPTVEVVWRVNQTLLVPTPTTTPLPRANMFDLSGFVRAGSSLILSGGDFENQTNDGCGALVFDVDGAATVRPRFIPFRDEQSRGGQAPTGTLDRVAAFALTPVTEGAELLQGVVVIDRLVPDAVGEHHEQRLHQIRGSAGMWEWDPTPTLHLPPRHLFHGIAAWIAEDNFLRVLTTTQVMSPWAPFPSMEMILFRVPPYGVDMKSQAWHVIGKKWTDGAMTDDADGGVMFNVIADTTNPDYAGRCPLNIPNRIAGDWFTVSSAFRSAAGLQRFVATQAGAKEARVLQVVEAPDDIHVSEVQRIPFANVPQPYKALGVASPLALTENQSGVHGALSTDGGIILFDVG